MDCTKMQKAYDEARVILTDLDPVEFQAVMGMMFDEYRRVNKGNDPVAMAQNVTRAVCRINDELGALE